MSLPLPLALCLGGVFCCSPLALYFLWLASISRRSRPVVVSAQFDLFAVLLGLGGFLCVAGRLIPTAVEAVVASRPADTFAAAGQRLDRSLSAGPLAGAGFAAVVLAGVAGGCWTRRDTLSVYNIHPRAVEGAVGAAAVAEGLPPGPPVLRTSRPFLGHVSVAVRRLDRPARGEVLGVLRTALANAPTAGGRAGGGLTAAAAALIGVSFLLIGVFLRLTRTI